MVPSSQPLRKCRRCPMPRAWPGQLMPLKQTSPAPARGQQSPCSAEQSRPSTASPRCPGPWSSLMLLFLPPLALPHGARSLTQLLPSQLFSTLQNPDEGRGGQHLVSHTSLPHIVIGSNCHLACTATRGLGIPSHHRLGRQRAGNSDPSLELSLGGMAQLILNPFSLAKCQGLGTHH